MYFSNGLLALIVAIVFGILTLLSQSQLTPFLQSVGLIQPTPLEGRVCSDEEICVVIAQFTGERGGDQQINMLEVLNEAAADVGDVSVIPIDYPLENRIQAREVAAIYNATLVIYGRVVAGGATVSYEVTRTQEDVATQIEGEFRTTASQVENFDVFLYEGMQSRYIFSFTIGQLYFFKDRYWEALRAFNAALTGLDADQSDDLSVSNLHLYRGYSYRQLDDDAAAEIAYTEAIRLDPNDAIAHNFRGDVLYDQGKLEEALVDFAEAIHLDPEYATAYANRGVVLGRQRKLDEAIDDFTEAIRLDPDNAMAYITRGTVFAWQRKLDEAIDDFTEAIRLDPDNAMAYNNRGLTLMHQAKLDDAIADFTEGIRLDPHNATAYINRGLALSEQGNRDEAIADYTEAIVRDPNFALAYNNRGVELADQGKLDEAIADYTEAINLNQMPATVFAYNNRGGILYNRGKLDEAISDYSEAIRLDPDGANAYWSRGSAHYDQGAFALAIADYRTYERLTGQLEPFMVTRIAEMEAALGTPTAVATP